MTCRKLGWTTMNDRDFTGARGRCIHDWRAEFVGDGINWGMGVRYRHCRKCHAYQEYAVPPVRRKPDPYPPCRQVDYGKIAREVEGLLNRKKYLLLFNW